MTTAFHSTLTTDLVPKRTAARILRDVNRYVGSYIANTILPRKFSRQAYLEYPDVIRRRSKRYAAYKRKRVGHDIPNVLTGKMHRYVHQESRITATQHGGRVYIRNYFPMRAHQRQELEVVSGRDKTRIAKEQETLFERLVNDPRFRRKRAVKRKKG